MDSETSLALSNHLKASSKTQVSLDSQFTLSLPLLSIFDETTIPSSSVSDSTLINQSTKAIQLLTNSIFSLPLLSSISGDSANPHHVPTATSHIHKSSNDPLVSLPPPTDLERNLLPREKKLPVGADKKPLTKWEEFARKKGIGKKRKDKKVWDEEKGEWRDSWGYGKKMAEREGMEDWAVEVKGDEGKWTLKGFKVGRRLSAPSCVK